MVVVVHEEFEVAAAGKDDGNAEDEEKTQKDVQTTAEPSAASAFYQMDHLDGPLSSFENEFPFFYRCLRNVSRCFRIWRIW